MTNLHPPRALFYLGKQYTCYVEVWFRKQTHIKNDNSNGEIQSYHFFAKQMKNIDVQVKAIYSTEFKH